MYKVPALQGFYAALRLVSACQLGRDPSLAVITLSDPPPRLAGIDSSTIAGFAQKKWTIEVCYIYMVWFLYDLIFTAIMACVHHTYVMYIYIYIYMYTHITHNHAGKYSIYVHMYVYIMQSLIHQKHVYTCAGLQ